MRRSVRSRLVVVTLAVALPAAAAHASFGLDDGPRGDVGEVAIFFYAWYGTPNRDGGWAHWSQNGATPPSRIASAFVPVRGAYSSSDRKVLAEQMDEIAAAGVDTVIVSWWGRGSVEDGRLPAVAAAARARGLRVAVHVEPYAGRTPQSVAVDVETLRPLGITDAYVYDSTTSPDDAWAEANAGLAGARLFAHTSLPGKAAAGRFAGLYTYDVLVHGGRSFPRVCASARRLGLLCAPSVGPGFDARRATGEARTRPRRDGATYDAMWRSAVRARADVVTITSYNEWHEGTQIEPARVAAGAESYEGAWGRTGAAAERAYLDRTAEWALRYAELAGRSSSSTSP